MMIRNSQERGFSLIITAVAFCVMLGMLGLSLDVGRMFILKSELQAYVDAAAMAAATRLDGTRAGITAAENLAHTGPDGPPNALNFDTTVMPSSNITTAYGNAPTGAFDSYSTASSPTSNTYAFVSVSATYPVSMYFLPAIGAFNGTWSIASSYTVTSTAVAGQRAGSAGPTNIVPMAPYAFNNNAAANFGFAVGTRYTLKYANGNATGCEGDFGRDTASWPPQHHFVDIGGGNSDNALKAAIENGYCPDCPITPGTYLSGVPGNRGNSILSEFVTRSSQDPAQETNYANYLADPAHNNRRIVIAPLTDPLRYQNPRGNQVDYLIIGFGAFLIDTTDLLQASSPSGWICGSYLGPANNYSGGSAGGDGRVVYRLGLYR